MLRQLSVTNKILAEEIFEDISSKSNFNIKENKVTEHWLVEVYFYICIICIKKIFFWFRLALDCWV